MFVRGLRIVSCGPRPDKKETARLVYVNNTWSSKLLNKTKTLGLTVALAVSLSFPASAQLISRASKIGAYAGAMAYCRDNYMKSSDAGHYALLALRAADEFFSLKRRDRVKALVTRNAALRGNYLGDILDANRCVALRRLLTIRYVIN